MEYAIETLEIELIKVDKILDAWREEDDSTEIVASYLDKREDLVDAISLLNEGIVNEANPICDESCDYEPSIYRGNKYCKTHKRHIKE
jgi:hypothetical protein